MRVMVPRVKPYTSSSPCPGYTGRTARPRVRLLQGEAARVETGRVELRLEVLHGPRGVVGEDVRDDADLAVVVPREVDVRVRDEVDRDLVAGRAAHGEAERAVARGKDAERGRVHGPRALLRVAEEAPR